MLDKAWALQHPADYLDVIFRGIPEVLANVRINTNHIIGIGVAFTSCTVLPVSIDGTPLCLLERFRDQPHSWPKLWKHHAAVEEAAILERALTSVDAQWIARYGGHVSVEWLWPKLLEIARDAPEVFRATDRIVEAADWIIHLLTGVWSRNIGGAGFKAFYQPDLGSFDDIWATIVPPDLRTSHTKVRGPVMPLGVAVGTLEAKVATRLGLSPRTVVATGMIDAHAAVLGAGGIEPGTMTMVMGTSTCHLIMDKELVAPEGIFGVVKSGIRPEFYAYEAGQAAVGDLFGWVAGLIRNSLPNKSIYDQLEEEASKIPPGGTGLLVLDWWNGNRSVLGDVHLSGTIVGLRLDSTLADIYRAAMEGTGFGTRRILESFENAGVHCARIVACGGLPFRNELVTQIYADILGRPIEVAPSVEATALGAAIAAAVAAGPERGGYADVPEAVAAMISGRRRIIRPNPSAIRTYKTLYRHYGTLHDWFGRENPHVMHGILSKTHL